MCRSNVWIIPVTRPHWFRQSGEAPSLLLKTVFSGEISEILKDPSESSWSRRFPRKKVGLLNSRYRALSIDGLCMSWSLMVLEFVQEAPSCKLVLGVWPVGTHKRRNVRGLLMQIERETNKSNPKASYKSSDEVKQNCESSGMNSEVFASSKFRE